MIAETGRISILFFLFIVLTSCKDSVVPKPTGFFRLEFPEKEYRNFESACNFSFEYPVYGEIRKSKASTSGVCWYDLGFEFSGATIYLTYKPLNDNLFTYVEDVRKIVYKHIPLADDIQETGVSLSEKNVYGILYDIKGNAASSVNFYITDSTTGFVSGALYFDVQPNKDSLAPAIDFFRRDIVHLIHSFQWN